MIDYDNYEIDFKKELVYFRNTIGTPGLGVMFESLNATVKPMMHPHKWAKLMDDIGKHYSGSDQPDPAITQPGESIPTFGRLVGINRVQHTANFITPSGDQAIISVGMLTEITSALYRVGVISGDAASGVALALAGKQHQQDPDPVEQIVKQIKNSSDPFVTAGQLLSRVTNAITEAMREEGDDDS